MRPCDVRERFECGICRIEGSVLMPLPRLPRLIAEIPRDADVVTVCHGGQRSLAAARVLRTAGIEGARSLRGGIEAWARIVDPAMPRYGRVEEQGGGEVPKVGLEPTRACAHGALNAARLPIPPLRRGRIS